MSVAYSNKKTLSDLDLGKYKRALLRLDLNVPVKDGVITDTNRIVQTLPTINLLLNQGLKIIVLSHFSRIKSIDDIKSGKKSLKLVADSLQGMMPNHKVLFIEDTDFDTVRQKIDSSEGVDIFVLENTRYYDVDCEGNVVKRESKNDPWLAEFWASLGDVYVNDAFGTCHRAHASNAGLAKRLPSAIGLLVEKEIKNLSLAVESQEKPKVLILGGSKVSDKLKLINAIAPKVDKVLIGGGMVYTFLKSMGKEIGKSIVEEEMIGECKSLLAKYGDKLLLPVDHMVSPEFKDVKGSLRDVDDTNWSDMMALDIGTKTEDLYCNSLSDAKVVIWNGPMGVFEFDNFSSGTKAVAGKLAEITAEGAYTVIGGGDSAAAADQFGLSSKMSFISTGGGASLCFFEGSPMPGIESIEDK